MGNPDWLVASVTGMFVLMTVTGLFFYVSFCVAVAKTKQLRDNPFYRLVLALAAADCLCLLVNLGYAAPAIYMQRTWGFEQTHIGFVMQLGWFPMLLLVGTLAVNRCVMICGTEAWQRRLFSPPATWTWIAGCWLLGTLLSSHALHDDYAFLLYPTEFSWGYDLTAGAQAVASFEVTLVTLVTLLTVICNGLVFRKIYHQHRAIADTLNNSAQQQQRQKRERMMFVQFFCVSLVLFVLGISFNVLPRLFEFTPAMGIWISFNFLLNGSCNGYVYFGVNSQVRGKILDLWRCKIKTDASAANTLQVTAKAKDGVKSTEQTRNAASRY